jgi:aspartate aminotransferase
MKFSERISGIQPSVTLDITSKAKSMLAAGEDVVILAAGEPDFDTPECIKEAAREALKDGKTKYTPASGTLSLKKAVCRKFKNDNGLEYEPSQIVVSCGAKHSLYNTLTVLCNPGDEVIVIHPFWLSYPEMVKLAGAEPVIVKTKRENDFKPTVREIRAAISKKTRAIILNSPSNPCGAVYEERDLREIAEVCVEAGITVISDEIYEKIIFGGKKHFSIAAASKEAKAATVVINGVSKSYSMTGWRIGYLAAEHKIAALVSNLQSQSTSNPCSISQAAAEYAILNDSLEAEMEKNREEYEKRRDGLALLLSAEKKIKPFIPSGAFYMFCDVSATGMDSVTFSKKLLDEKKVAVIPGGPFGEDAYVRISFATDPATIKKGIERIGEWLGEI